MAKESYFTDESSHSGHVSDQFTPDELKVGIRIAKEQSLLGLGLTNLIISTLLLF